MAKITLTVKGSAFSYDDEVDIPRYYSRHQRAAWNRGFHARASEMPMVSPYTRRHLIQAWLAGWSHAAQQRRAE